MSERDIFLFDGWSKDTPSLIGVLHVNQMRGKEVYSLEWSDYYLNNFHGISLSPDTYFFKGRQNSQNGKLFGFLSDSSPDRWGRMLMERKEISIAESENRKPHTLTETDFLLGVDDRCRMGALRLSLSENGAHFLADDSMSVPPIERLRDLEAASLSLEDDSNTEQMKWINMLIAPGSSLGGARPKANVIDTENNLWIAKFPARNDKVNVGAWEMVTHDLAEKCGLNIPPAKLFNFSSLGATFVVKRFDRNKGKRIHFASAMTMLNKQDGESLDCSYLDIADYIHTNSCLPKKDLKELWDRMIFNMLVSNTDDHLRNHGFVLGKKGWELSPLYDVNPNPLGNSLSLMIDYSSNAISLDTAMETFEFYDISKPTALKSISHMAAVINSQWKPLAKKYKIKDNEINDMKGAFALPCQIVKDLSYNS